MIIKAVIDRFEGEKAVLISTQKAEIILPKNLLPENSKEGGSLKLEIHDDKLSEEKNRELAKEILNEILHV
jgi:hypothetical protein